MNDHVAVQTVAGYPVASDLLPIEGRRIFVAAQGEVDIVEDF